MPPEPLPRRSAGPLAELLARLRALWRNNATVAQRWKRSLPFGDYVVDRGKRRANGLRMRLDLRQRPGPWGREGGRETWSGPAFARRFGALTIGDHCSISAALQIYRQIRRVGR